MFHDGCRYSSGMIKVDLITGFLGSGKTTFLKKYARYYMDQGQRVGILENDYGAVNVDMLLLNELRGENCELEMVAGACDSDCHKRRFKTKLIAMAMSKYDRVIIEPSGVFDVDEFFDSLREEPLENWYEIGNVIAIVDAKLSQDLSEDGDFYLASQIANAGMVLLSRTQLASEAQMDATLAYLKRAAEVAQLKKSMDDIIFAKDWERLTADDFAKIAACGYSFSSYVKRTNGQDNDYSTVYFLELPMTEEKLRRKIDGLMATDTWGYVLRVKGFFQENGQWHQVNATREEVAVEEMPVGQEVFIIIGERLDERAIRSYMEKE